MDMQTKKLDLIDWLVNLEDERILDKLSSFKNEETSDWYDDVPEEAKASIQRGLEDVRQGKLIPHEKVMENIRKKYNIKK